MTGLAGGMLAALTVVFAGAGLFCLQHCVSRSPAHRVADRIGYAFHAATCAAMTTMLWWPTRLPTWQVTLFAAACGWFVVQATGVTLTSLRPSVGPGGTGVRRDHGGRLRCLHHAAVMALMAWMCAAMPGLETASGRGGIGAAMPTMQMPMPGTSGRIVAIAGGAYCLVAALLLLTGGSAAMARRRRFRRAHDDLAHGLMTAGMAAILLVAV